MAIIISKYGKDAQKVDKVNFENEDYMQEYIHNNPDAIPVYEIQKDKKLFVAKREFATNAGPIDALAIDQDGDLYVIETKLETNSDRRKVIAQALDYGAALWKRFDDFDVFIDILNKEAQLNFKVELQEKLKDFFDIDDEGVSLFMSTLKNNLNEGNLKFVIIMDSMDEKLKDVITYVNRNSQFDIYAVQLEYYKHDEFEIIIPKIFGVEVKKNIKSTTVSKNNLTRDGFESAIINNTSKDISDAVLYFRNEFEKTSNANTNIIVEYSTAYMRLKYKDKSGDLCSIAKNGKLSFKKDGSSFLTDLNDSSIEKITKFQDSLGKEKEINSDNVEDLINTMRSIIKQIEEW